MSRPSTRLAAIGLALVPLALVACGNVATNTTEYHSEGSPPPGIEANASVVVHVAEGDQQVVLNGIVVSVAEGWLVVDPYDSADRVWVPMDHVDRIESPRATHTGAGQSDGG